MKYLTSSLDSASLGLVQSMLEASGIACTMRNENLLGLVGGVPFNPELWVLDDTRFGEAKEFLANWNQPTPAT